MRAPSTPAANNLRRLLLLAASLGVGAVVWFMLGQSEAASAVERQAGQHVVARVNGVAITEEDVLQAAASELRELERRRHEILDQYLDDKVRDLLVETAARERGVTPDEYIAAEVGGRPSEVPRERLDALYERLAAGGDVEIVGGGIEHP